MRADLPTGTVTLLFTDIEGSTRLIDELGEEAYVRALAEHRRVLRVAFSAHGGVEVDTQGDAFLYVFADPVWAEAFFESPPTAFGCGVCTSMGDPTPVQRVGDKATSYVLYRKKVGGQSWVATTSYVLSGSVVVNGLYFPVNIGNDSPSATDLGVATAYTKAALQLLKKIST